MILIHFVSFNSFSIKCSSIIRHAIWFIMFCSMNVFHQQNSTIRIFRKANVIQYTIRLKPVLWTLLSDGLLVENWSEFVHLRIISTFFSSFHFRSKNFLLKLVIPLVLIYQWSITCFKCTTIIPILYPVSHLLWL